MRKNRKRIAIVHLDDDPSVRAVGPREGLIDTEDITSYPKGNNLTLP